MTEVLATIATIAMWGTGSVFYGDPSWPSCSEWLVLWTYD